MLRNRVHLLLLVLLSAVVLYLSWVPSPILHLPSFLPDRFRAWTNRQSNENLRTAVPFLFMGMVFSLGEFAKPFSLSRYLLAFLFFTLLVSVAEAVQKFIPNRSPDLMDVVWGMTGSLLGMIFPLPFRSFFRSRRIKA